MYRFTDSLPFEDALRLTLLMYENKAESEPLPCDRNRR